MHNTTDPIAPFPTDGFPTPPGAQPVSPPASEQAAAAELAATELTAKSTEGDAHEIDEDTVVPDVSVPVCSHCGAPQGQRDLVVCRRCGYHERLGIIVELDPWDQVEEGAAESAPQSASHLHVWMNLIPHWVWPVAACVAVVIAESVAARLLTEPESSLRTTWSLTQLGIGMLLLSAVHVMAYTLSVTENDNTSVLDLLMRPIHCWLPTFYALPRRLAMVTTGASSLTAIVMSFVVIGGLPYEKLWDWGVKAPPKQNLMAAVMDQARKVQPKDQSLEEAVEDFAGKATDAAPPAKPHLPRDSTECLIIGFIPDPQNPDDFQSLILAGEVRGQLKEVALVSAGISDEVRKELNVRMRKLLRPQPFIASSQPAFWLEPRLACRVSYATQAKSGRLLDVKFTDLLADLRLE